MDRDHFPSPGGRAPNPLRPYYSPPTIGSSHIPSSATTNSIPRTSGQRAAGSGSLSSAARDLLPEIDLDLKSTTSEAWQQTRGLFDTLAWRYTSVLLAQPFDVAKTLLQVSYIHDTEPALTDKRRTLSGTRTSRRAREDRLFDEDDGNTSESYDEDDEIPDYFSDTAPRSRSPRRRKRTPFDEDASPSPTPRPRNRRGQSSEEQEAKIVVKKPGSILATISSLYNTTGAVGLWRASNTTFLYAILLRTTDSFIRSLLLTVLGLPDIIGPEQGGLAPGLSTSGGAGFSGVDISDSPNPISSLIVVGLSSCLTGLLLAPLDLIRTRLLVTPISHGPRGVFQNIRRLPSLTVPSALWFPTALYHTIPNLFSAFSPTFLRHQLRITPDLTPGAWSLAAFVTNLIELFVRLPLETLVRRAQVAEIRKLQPGIPLIIEPAPYTGVMSTVYNIMYVEGETTTKAANGMLRKRRGQGVIGLERGWQIGFWGLIGVYAAGALGAGETRSRGEF